MASARRVLSPGRASARRRPKSTRRAGPAPVVQSPVRKLPVRRQLHERVSFGHVRGLEDLAVPAAHVRGIEAPRGGRQEAEDDEIAKGRGRSDPRFREPPPAGNDEECEEDERPPGDVRHARDTSGEGASPARFEKHPERGESHGQGEDSRARAAQEKRARRRPEPAPRVPSLLGEDDRDERPEDEEPEVIFQEEERRSGEKRGALRVPPGTPREENPREERESAAEALEHRPRGGLEEHRRSQEQGRDEEQDRSSREESAGNEPAHEEKRRGRREDEGDEARQARGGKRRPKRRLEGSAHESPERPPPVPAQEETQRVERTKKSQIVEEVEALRRVLGGVPTKGEDRLLREGFPAERERDGERASREKDGGRSVEEPLPAHPSQSMRDAGERRWRTRARMHGNR